MKIIKILSITLLGAYLYSSDEGRHLPLLDTSHSIELKTVDDSTLQPVNPEALCYMYNPEERTARANKLRALKDAENKMDYLIALQENTILAQKQMSDGAKEGARIGNFRVRIFYGLAAVGFLMGLLYKFAIKTPDYLK